MYKNGKKKAAIAIVLSVAMSTQTFAAVIQHDISTGDLNINKDTHTDGDTYVVTGSSDTYTVSVTDGVDTTITLDGVNIDVTDESAIHIGAGSEVELIVSGENHVNSNYYFEDYAAIHISDKDSSLTITDDGNDNTDDTLYASAGDGSYAAAIGSNGYETDDRDMNADITIKGSLSVYTYSDGDGTGIGSGEDGDMTGNITISGGAYVEAISGYDGAGIGSGYGGDMNGNITIDGDAEVFAYSDYDGAGIGAGYGGDMNGTITIGDSAVVDAASYGGAGIGSGESGEMAGAITIKDDAIVTADAGIDAAAIGSGDYGDMTGTIQILDSTTVYLEDAGIGSGDEGNSTGSYVIGADITLHAADSTLAPGDEGYIVETIKGSDAAEDLEKVIDFAVDPVTGKPVNLSIQVPAAPADSAETAIEQSIVWNEAKSVSVVLDTTDGPTTLIEKELSDEANALLIGAEEADKVLYAANLSFDKAYDGAFWLRFHLGTEYAGKTVSLRHIDEDGTVVMKSVTVNSMWMVLTLTDTLGDFAIVAE